MPRRSTVFRQNVKQIALGLEARGFVRLVPDPADGRTTRIEPTDHIREFDEPEMVERTKVMLNNIFGSLTPSETRDLLGLLRRWLPCSPPPTQERSNHRDALCAGGLRARAA